MRVQPDVVPGPSAPETAPAWRTMRWMLPVAALLFLYYWLLVTDGRLLGVPPTRYGLVFNNMLEHLLAWRFDVDPAVIMKEGWTRDGRTYAYFGVVTALLRLPLLALPGWAGIDVTALSCAIAATIAALAEILAVRRAGALVAGLPWRRAVEVMAALACVFGGPQVLFLRPSMYQEPITWAMAMAAVFVLLMFRWCTDAAGRRTWHLVAMAILAGLCLNTRVSTSLGLYAACGAVLLVEGVRWLSRRDRAAATGLAALLLSAAVLAAFMLVCGYVNYQRWGNPLTFQDYRYYNTITPDDPVHGLIRDYGFFNLRRIPFGLSYYLLPVWAIIRPDHLFLFREFQSRLFFLVEPPPTSFLLTDPALCALALAGVACLVRPRMPRLDGVTARLAALALCLPGALMLTAIAVTLRYRGEFYQGFLFLALFGQVAVTRWCGDRGRALLATGAVLVGVGILGAHLNLFVYKITPWGDYLPVEQIGWTQAYKQYLIGAYPTLSRFVQTE